MPDLRDNPELESYIIEHLDEAIEKGYIQPYFQPVIRTVSRQLCGMEALARWKDPVWGLLPPDSFIGVLEKHRRIHELDACILRQVCALYREAVAGRGVLIPISVNLSRLDYELCDIFAVVEEAVQTYMMPRSFLCIEITESALNENGALMHTYIDRFREAGYQVWMDDFGSGYSSLNVLKDFEFDELKVDMWFLSDFHQRSRKILSSIVHMAKEIEIQTLVEGVETEEQFEFLRNIGFEKVQGYLFGRPLPYMDCIRHVLDQGLTVEAPMHRNYYDTLGRVDVLSATPFLSQADRAGLISGRELNSIPLAVLELRSGYARLLLTNDAFDEATGAIDWAGVFGDIDTDPTSPDVILLRNISPHAQQLLEEARTSGSGKMYFVDSGEYYEIRAKRVAGAGELCSILLRMDNLSRVSEISRQEQLDGSLRAMYALYDQVAVVDLEKNSFTSLLSDAKEVQRPQEEDLSATYLRYAQQWIFPEDRQRFLLLTDISTFEQRMAESGRGFLCAHLRAKDLRGSYNWKLYLFLRIRDGVYYMLVRNAEAEVMDFLTLSSGMAEDAGDPFAAASLWRNFTLNSSLKFFWKDSQRRFVGASRSFLDFYGFHSMDDILGKTDEEMGWHLNAAPYQSDEWRVIREGVSTHSVPGSCLVRGENQRIMASKMPLYDRRGRIAGLLGYFFQSDELEGGTEEKKKQSRIDTLTGLLNARGISEEMYVYRDAYDLRKTDFARIHISVRDFNVANQRFGYDFGDSVIRAVAAALSRCCGNRASVGRVNGSRFVVLKQFTDLEVLDRLLYRLKRIPEEIPTVEGIPFSLYLSVGVALYGDVKDPVALISQADARMLLDTAGAAPTEQLQENLSQLFQVYEELPLSFSVYQYRPAEEGREADAVLLYANRRFARMVHMKHEAMLGHTVRELFPVLEAWWFEVARAAALEGKESEGLLYYPLSDVDFHYAVCQIIGPGFCAFTYQSEARKGEKAERAEKAEDTA